MAGQDWNTAINLTSLAIEKCAARVLSPITGRLWRELGWRN